MRQRTIVGLVLIFLGLLFLLARFGVIDITPSALWRLWPAVLIYAGLVRILRYFGV